MKIDRLVRAACLSVCVVGLAACATSEGPREGFAATDSYEPTSRVIHDVNVTLDENVLRPVAQGYDFVAPTLVQHLLGNGFSHLGLPRDLFNQILQGDIEGSLTTFGRFTVNTILGAGGLLDPATEFGLPRAQTDFGVTLGKFGVEEGSYIVLPFLGPSTVRDSWALIVDRALNPLTYIGYYGPFTSLDALGPALGATELVDTRNRNSALIDDALYESADSYVTLRAGYLQRRRALVAAGEGDEATIDSLPDIFDDEAPADAPAGQ